MRVAMLVVLLAACGDDGARSDPHELATCTTGAYEINMTPVAECERACVTRPTNANTCTVGVGKPQCAFGTTSFGGIDGCCAASSAVRVLFVECE